MQEYNFVSKDFYQVAVVGAGTCGLAVTARLCEDHPASIYTEDEHQRFTWLRQRGSRVNLISKELKVTGRYNVSNKYKPEDILVLDLASDEWMGQWNRQFEACQIPFLRLPMFFHPDPVNYDALVTYSYLNKREKDLMEVENVVGKEHLKHQAKKLRKKNMKKTPAPTGGFIANHNAPGITDINMRDWKDYYRPSTPLFKDFCREIETRYGLEGMVKKDPVVLIEYAMINIMDTNEAGKGFVLKTESGSTYCSKACIVTSGHRGNINYPIAPFKEHNPKGCCHTTHIFSGQKFPPTQVTEKIKQNKSTSIVVVGGGLTAAQLTHVAILSGVDKVYQILRGPLKIKHFDFHLDWVTKYKNVKKSAFYMLGSDEERHQMILDSREGGSVNPEYYKKLNKHIKSKKLDLLKFSNITEQKWDPESSTWDLTVVSKNQKNNSLLEDEIDETLELKGIDYIVFATGVQACVDELPFLSSICKEYPINFTKGLPSLTDNLQWCEDIPLFLLGKNAMLKMGPSSANLDGARLGAERIGWCLQEMKSKGEFDWSACSDACPCREESDELQLLPEDTDVSSIESISSIEDLSSTFETRMKLAKGDINWFSLLTEE